MRPILRLLLLAALIFGCRPAPAADFLISASVTVTNTATNGASITVGGSTRSWTNSVSVPSTQIAVTNSIGATATNLYRHVANFPFAGPLVLGFSSSNIITLRAAINATLSVSVVSNWASVSYSTNSAVTNMLTVRVPMDAEAITVRRYIADQLVQGISDHATSNSFSALSPALAAYLTLSSTQTVTGPKTFTGAAAFSSITTTGLVNRGSAISSVGSGIGAEQFGAGATASGGYALAVGNTAIASGSNATAIGSSAEAAGSNGVAVGWSARAQVENSVALGKSAGASGARSIAVGTAAVVSGADSIAIGTGANDGGFTNNVVLGNGAEATAANQVVLGSAAHTVLAPGLIDGPTITNANFWGTVGMLSGGLLTGTTVSNASVYASTGRMDNVTISNATLHATSAALSNATLVSPTMTNPSIGTPTFLGESTTAGPWRWGGSVSSSLANGNNTGVSAGNSTFLKLIAGPTANFAIAGFAGGSSGRLLVVYNATGQILTIANDSGIEPTAANRIYTLTGGDITTAGNSLHQFIYDANAARWVMIGMGGATNAANTNLWTVAGAMVMGGNIADSATVKSQVIGTNISFYVTNVVTSVNGAAGAITVPGFADNSTWTGSNAFTGGISFPGSGSHSIRVGNGAVASSYLGVAIGAYASASGYQGSAFGPAAAASHTNSTAIGAGATTSADNQVVLGTEYEDVVIPGRARIDYGVDFPNQTVGSPGADRGRLYVAKNGTNLVLVVKWPDGSTNAIATQP